MFSSALPTSDLRLRDNPSLTSRAISLPANSPMPFAQVNADVYESKPTQLIDEANVSMGVSPTRMSRIAPHIIRVERLAKPKLGPLATVLQIWEGEVLHLNVASDTMTVKLIDRQGLVPAHTADVGLDWVVPQDLELVRPGAVFYWTIYRETKRSTIKHAQEIRFRRLPNWTKRQVANVKDNASALLAKFKVAPQAD